MLTVIESPFFLSKTADFLDDDTRQALIDWIAVNPLAGDLIKGTGGLRKVRWGLPGRGKSGGMRVITYYIKSDGEIWLLMGYTKTKFDNLPADFLLALKKELFDE
jgi:hypothetical protein